MSVRLKDQTPHCSEENLVPDLGRILPVLFSELNKTTEGDADTICNCLFQIDQHLFPNKPLSNNGESATRNEFKVFWDRLQDPKKHGTRVFIFTLRDGFSRIKVVISRTGDHSLVWSEIHEVNETRAKWNQLCDKYSSEYSLQVE